jgi:hypothetical protein
VKDGFTHGDRGGSSTPAAFDTEGIDPEVNHGVHRYCPVLAADLFAEGTAELGGYGLAALGENEVEVGGDQAG